MLDEETKNEIFKSIVEEAMHIGYGKILFEFNVHANNVMSWEITETRKKKQIVKTPKPAMGCG